MRRDIDRSGGVTLTQLFVILSLAVLVGGSGAWAVKSYQASEQRPDKPQQPKRPQQPQPPPFDCASCVLPPVNPSLCMPFAVSQMDLDCQRCYVAQLNAALVQANILQPNPNVVLYNWQYGWGYYIPGGSGYIWKKLDYCP